MELTNKNILGLIDIALEDNQDITGWDVSGVTGMSFMFEKASLFNQDIGDWDVSNIECMKGMFGGATMFNQDIGDWDVSSVTYMSSMFYSATSFNQDISNWDVSNVTNMWGMFMNASSFNQDIGDWDVSGVKDMTGMFDGTALSTLNYDSILNSWSQLNLQKNVYFSAKGIKYSINSMVARQRLINTFNWTINDGGLI